MTRLIALLVLVTLAGCGVHNKRAAIRYLPDDEYALLEVTEACEHMPAHIRQQERTGRSLACF